MNDVGIHAGWRILHGSQEFFEITKSFHNGLQGSRLNHLTEDKKRLYLKVNDDFSRFTHMHHDCVIIHDPQPLSLIRSYRKSQPWIWRCHIDITDPNPELWDFLKGFILKYDGMICSSESYFKEDLPIHQRLMFPSINPLSEKNCDMSEKNVMKQITKAGIPTDKPIITQVSRLDPWKDPEGVIEGFKRVKAKVDCRLMLCYNAASDDPEGMIMYEKVVRKADKLLKDGEILLVVGNKEPLVNAIQRYSKVIIQKSTKEGFCLAVTEALWKGTPVVASRVGGIPVQIDDNESGFLLDPDDWDGFAERIIYLLEHPDDATEMGTKARAKVRDHFLITRQLSDYLQILDTAIHQGLEMPSVPTQPWHANHSAILRSSNQNGISARS